MISRKTALIATAAALCTVAGVAQAQTTYGTRAGFTAAAGATSTETFGGCGTGSVSFNGTLSSTTGPCTGILPGVTYSSPNGSLYIAGPGQSSNPTTALGVNVPNAGPLTIAFSQIQSAFGSDLFQNFGGGSQSGQNATFTLNFLLGGATVGTYTTPVASGTGSFFGLTGRTFDTVTISQANGYAVIDNVSFGTAAVPEPATWGMLILGFGLTGAALRGRKAKVAFA